MDVCIGDCAYFAFGFYTELNRKAIKDRGCPISVRQEPGQLIQAIPEF